MIASTCAFITSILRLIIFLCLTLWFTTDLKKQVPVWHVPRLGVTHIRLSHKTVILVATSQMKIAQALMQWVAPLQSPRVVKDHLLD